MNFHKIDNDVFGPMTPIVSITREDVTTLKNLALDSSRQRSRVCAHRKVADKVHEMLISLTRDAYIRPHRHLGKSESFHVIEGLIDVVIFDDMGRIQHVISMTDFLSGGVFYYRLADPLFHTVMIRSEVAVFHETTMGPFDKQNTVYPSWSPHEEDLDYLKFMCDLASRVKEIREKC